MKNKRAQSDIVSYVLLIVIAMGLAAGVYAYLNFYASSVKDKEKCSADVALSIETYNCTQQKITLDLLNTGYFNINGFFIRGSNDTNKIAAVMLNSTDSFMLQGGGPGKYDYILMTNAPLENQNSSEVTFDYSNLRSPLKKIEIQPYVYGTQGKNILLCTPIDYPVDNCN